MARVITPLDEDWMVDEFSILQPGDMHEMNLRFPQFLEDGFTTLDALMDEAVNEEGARRAAFLNQISGPAKAVEDRVVLRFREDDEGRLLACFMISADVSPLPHISQRAHVLTDEFGVDAETFPNFVFRHGPERVRQALYAQTASSEPILVRPVEAAGAKRMAETAYLISLQRLIAEAGPLGAMRAAARRRTGYEMRFYEEDGRFFAQVAAVSLAGTHEVARKQSDLIPVSALVLTDEERVALMDELRAAAPAVEDDGYGM